MGFIFKKIDSESEVIRYHQHQSAIIENDLNKNMNSNVLTTHLPIVSIKTNGQKIPGNELLDEKGDGIAIETTEDGKEDIFAKLYTFENINDWNSTDQKSDVESDILIHIRGNSSRSFDKHSYRIELIKENNPEDKNDVPLLGMNEESSWILHGPFFDKTLIRNYVGMNISAMIMGDVPEVRFCELMIDDEYQGLYILMETIKVSEQRLNLTKYEPGDPVMSYVVSLEARGELDSYIDTFSFYSKKLEENGRYELVYPGKKYQDDWVKDYVSRDFSRIENMIYSWNVSLEPEFYLECLDEESFVDYYILQEFMALNDMYMGSTYFYKDVRGKLHIGPVWDYNNAFNNYILEMPVDELLLCQRGFYSQLMKSERFVECVISRYKELRNGVLSEEFLLNYIDETVAWLGNAIERNYSKWGYVFQWENLSNNMIRRYTYDNLENIESINPSSHEMAVQMMKSFISERGQWMDENIESLRQYCHSSRNMADSTD